MSTVDTFLKITGVDGESTDAKHANEIEVESWSWGLQNAGGSGGTSGGAGTSKAQFDALTFVAATSLASTELFYACAAGEVYEQAVLTVRKAGSKPLEFLVITLETVSITGFQQGGSIHGAPADQVSLDFGVVRVTYTPQNPDGSGGTPVKRGWNRIDNLPA
jgi:type VI secretion system secreted protein Hcp